MGCDTLKGCYGPKSGHFGDGAHGQWGTWLMEHMGIIMHRSRWGIGVMGHMSNEAHI